jgi:hypothetical protein
MVKILRDCTLPRISLEKSLSYTSRWVQWVEVVKSGLKPILVNLSTSVVQGKFQRRLLGEHSWVWGGVESIFSIHTHIQGKNHGANIRGALNFIDIFFSHLT